MGWFLGFRLGLPMNHQGRTKALKVTGGYGDRQPLEPMTAALRGTGVGHRG